MEGKKLNVDEIIYDLKVFSNLEIEEAKKQGAEKAVLLATLTLDLIQRLQDEKEEIKNEYVKLDLECQKLQAEKEELKQTKFGNWKVKFFKLKAEYEQKFEDGELVSKEWHDEQVLHLQEEIEMLKEENSYLKQCGDNFLDDYNKAQVQVDELTKENNRYAELFGMVGKDFYTIEVGEWEKVKSGVKDLIQQAVKDTAKEILEKIWSYMGSNQKFWIVNEEHITILDCDKLWDFTDEIRKNYGVEMEYGVEVK